jgi:mono/diheme cytochrome c family protein
LTANPKTAIKIVLKGIAGPLSAGEKQYNGIMPGHETILNDRQIADVLSYARSAWGNKAKDISVDMVREIRAEVADRKKPWKERDLK